MGLTGSSEPDPSVKPGKVVVPREQAGSNRLNARDDWNYQELDIMGIFKQFDVDKSGFLEEKEFKELLKAYNKGTEAKPEEFQWMLKVADKNHDNKISRRELMYAMQAWYGYTHLSETHLRLFEKYDIDHNGYLDQQEFLNLLQELNEGKPVDPVQAQVVLAMAGQLNDGKLGRYELLGAVGIWYVSVGREPTPEMEMTLKAMKDEPTLNICTIVMPLLFGGLSLGYGLKYRDNGVVGDGISCKADLGGYLILYGALQLIGLPFTCLSYYMRLNQRDENKCFGAVVGLYLAFSGIASMVVAILGLKGVIDTWDEADRMACGEHLWNISCGLFVAIPACNLLLCSCACCCLCGLVAVHSGMRSHEAELQEEQQGLVAVSAKPSTSRDSNASETKPLMAGA